MTLLLELVADLSTGEVWKNFHEVQGLTLRAVVFAAEGQPDITTTAIVAAASAILGAIAGGFASFKANVALDVRRRRARAAIRRKAKVYTPLRAELIALGRAMDKNEHLTWGIDTKERDPEWPQRGPVWRLWPSMKDDGRAATAASQKIVASLDLVDSDINALERVRNEAFATFEEVGKRVYAEVIGEEMTVQGAWDSGSALLEIFQDVSNDAWYPLHRTEGEAKFSEIRAGFNTDPRISGIRQRIADSDHRLKGDVKAAISELETGIATIARKHELEEIED